MYNESGGKEGDTMNQNFIIASGSQVWTGKTWSRNIELAKTYRSSTQVQAVVKKNRIWQGVKIDIQRLEF